MLAATAPVRPGVEASLTMGDRVMSGAAGAARRTAHLLIRAYQLTASALVGRHCRHLPSCSAFADDAIARHGLWFGGWMGLARICRCHPWGTDGFDPVPAALPRGSRWFAPWRAGIWRPASWRRLHAHDAAPVRNGEDEVNAPPSNGSAGLG